MSRFIPHHLAFGQLIRTGLLVGLTLPAVARAGSSILEGWDLFETSPPTTVFNGIHWEGVPLGTYDFGGSIGIKPVGDTDTIMRRLDVADGPAETIPIELVALQLQGVEDPTLFITLQSLRGGPASTGTMTVSFGPEGNPHGTFASLFDVFFDVRLGSLTGPILDSGSVALTSSGNSWSHEVPLGIDPTVVIDGVNHRLNGSDGEGDFWPAFAGGPGAGSGTPLLVHVAPTGSQHHGVTPPGVPDGGSGLALLWLATAVLGVARRRPQDPSTASGPETA